MSVPKSTAPKVSLPKSAPPTKMAAKTPAATPTPAKASPPPPASVDRVQLDRSESPASKSDTAKDTALADSLMKAYSETTDVSDTDDGGSKTENAADSKAEGAAEIKAEGTADSKKAEPRPFFGSPGKLYSEKHEGKGDDVKEFQQMLGLDQSGEFDQKTSDAVKAFQKKNGLKEDGILGPDTIGKLNESQKAEGAESPKPAGGAYKTEKDGSIYHALMAKGFSETEIANGKLVEETRRLNPDLKSSHLKAGTDLQVPIRRERQPSAEGEHAVGMQSEKLEPGQAQSSSATNNDLGIDHSSKLSKSEEGDLSLRTDATNKKNSDANLTTTLGVDKGGVINTASSATDEGVVTDSVAENADGSAGLKTKTTSTPEGTTFDFEGLGKPNDTSLTSDGETALIRDPGSETAGDATGGVDISESSDGVVENFFGNVAEFFGHEEDAASSVNIDGIDKGSVFKDEAGRVKASTSNDEGAQSEVTLAPGDSDDSLLERTGEFVDEAWEAGKSKLLGLIDSFLGTEKPSKEAHKSAVR